MVASQQEELKPGSVDHAKLIAAVCCVLAGLLGFYWLSSQALAVRILVVIVGFLAAAGAAYSSVQGQQFLRFTKEAWSETRRVVWPDRKETVQMTLTVFGFVVIAALFLWIVDKSLEWILYGLILGWKS
ncbi:MAG: preprotein translocase subunit SecE [Betaproteobacteria bacterium]|nr:preprotein translocase subunit SecE [Pseudomonadota bacterium]NBO12946.1 preprotein translocase subunit SecE [Betaproteobacteria bacterium]NBO44853.1 preprotein translocase subunit SecE [Betaproteobacteria bacterium]NBP10650.1 preprotein translocase subunit SecE [Betaproteobacteria bacterium]NBP62257.1 preprotein translocase subunit SecE [Betaproteobacteria bacterium]